MFIVAKARNLRNVAVFGRSDARDPVAGKRHARSAVRVQPKSSKLSQRIALTGRRKNDHRGPPPDGIRCVGAWHEIVEVPLDEAGVEPARTELIMKHTI